MIGGCIGSFVSALANGKNSVQYIGATNINKPFKIIY
jgi:hypothetical protein